MKILFLHGWHSIPGGVKPTYLIQHGHTVINPALDDDDFAAALRTAQAEFDTHQPDVIVGSSRGGALAINIDSKNTPLLLLCPAWKSWGTVRKLKLNSVILHSREDEVIPFADRVQLRRPKVQLSFVPPAEFALRDEEIRLTLNPIATPTGPDDTVLHVLDEHVQTLQGQRKKATWGRPHVAYKPSR